MSKMISVEAAEKIMQTLIDRLDSHRKDAVTEKCTASNFIALNMDVDNGKLVEGSRRTFTHAYGAELAYGTARAEASWTLNKLIEEAK